MTARIRGPITFDAVDFTYPSRPGIKIIKRLNLKIKEGTKIGIIGSSGCGKSTISQLILKFYTPVNGSIKFDGCDIRSIDDHTLRSAISIVNQEPNLFSCSILDNITYGCYQDCNNSKLMERVFDAAKRANVHDAIMTLPDGYETEVGDRGSQLSGGQKQRIAIARALFRNSNILILDEATSALDAFSKRKIEETIHELSGNKTVISITHDMKSLENYDRIYFMSKGEIVQSKNKTNGLNHSSEFTRL